jgi:hypothetical protein
MKLELDKKLTTEEITELRKRVFSFTDQMFMEGLSIGRELNREPFHEKTEQYVKDRISAMTSYFINDALWDSMPPRGYNPDPNVDIPEPSEEMSNKMNGAIQTAGNGGCEPDNLENFADDPDAPPRPEKPDWANKARPFK